MSGEGLEIYGMTTSNNPLLIFGTTFFVDIFWKSFVNNMERIRDGQPTDYETSAPSVNK